jgi:hypothetical protein
MDDDTAPKKYAEHIKNEMDVREIVTVMCELHECSKVPVELVYDVAELSGMERNVATRRVREFVSTAEIVELEDGYVQTRRHFEDTFE